MNFSASLRSEILKTKRTPAVYIMLAVAAVIPLIQFINFIIPSDENVSPWEGYFQQGHAFINFMFVQVFVVLASTLLMQTEYKNNTWKQVLTSPQSFSSIYFSKFVVLQILTLMLIICFNIFLLMFAGLLDLILSTHYATYISRWPEICKIIARTYVASLGMSAFCYWMAVRFKNFIIPVTMGIALYAAGPVLLFEFAKKFAANYPFALPIVVVTKKFSSEALSYQFLSFGYAIVFLGGGYLDFLLRQTSWRMLLPTEFIGNPLRFFSMRKNILIVSYRNLIKDKVYAFFNITGLTIGLTSSTLLMLYIIDELSFDRYHVNADNIYRVISDIKESDNAFTWASTPFPLATGIVEQTHKVKNAVRFFKTGRTMYRTENKQFYEDRFFLADSSVFEMFTYKFLAGDPTSALLEPYSIVMTKTTASKYYPNVLSAVGQTIQNQSGETFTITGILEDVPINSHFRFNALISLSTRASTMPDTWGRLGAFTYVQLEKGTAEDEIQTVLDTLVSQKIDPLFSERGIETKLSLQPITSIHLYSRIQDEAEEGGDISYIYVFSAVAILILLIACSNYMNLATARSINRAKEVGIRKVVGSQRHELVFQFLTESIILAMIAFVFTIGCVYLLMPGFNFLANKSLDFISVLQPSVLITLVGLAILAGIVGGSYPAIYLSSFQASDVLKGNRISASANSGLRRTLVIVQFSISVFMIIATMIVYNQMEFMRTKDLGFKKEHVVRIPLSGDDQRKGYPLFVQQLQHSSDIVSVGMSSAFPGERIGKLLLKVEDNDGKFSDRGVDIFYSDYHYAETLGMKIVQGRNFSENIPSDTLYGILVNEAMVKRMGWADPIGKRFRPQRKAKDGREIEKRVVGVVKDYHQSSLYDAIEPLVIVLSDERNDNVFVRTSENGVKRSVAAVEDAWKKAFPNEPLEFKFLDQDFDSQYQADQKRSYIFTLFALLTTVIACLGLLGLAAFTTEQRTKEIGLRKIAGASVSGLMLLVATDFLKLIGVAILLAIPLTWYFTNEWLENFAYRIDLMQEWPTFVIAAFVAFIVTLFTTSYHVIKAARTNPVMALRA
jgi:putative ABC transport system permease protein